VLIVTEGHGFLVRADRPEDLRTVGVNPVLHVRAIVELRTLILSDFNRMVAYGPHGKSWFLDDLSREHADH